MIGIVMIFPLLRNISSEHVLLPWLLKHNPPKITPKCFTHFYREFMNTIQMFLTKDFLLFLKELSFVFTLYWIYNGIL